jgi:hypothetical protein
MEKQMAQIQIRQISNKKKKEGSRSSSDFSLMIKFPLGSQE